MKLTNREKQILIGVCEGKTNKCLSLEIGVCKRTVESIKNELYLKIDANCTAKAIIFAIENGYYHVEVKRQLQPY